MQQLENFILGLQQTQLEENSFNPWRDCDLINDNSAIAPVIRSAQLSSYLQKRLGKAKYILLAEGLSYQGGKFTGIAMTSERIILGNHETVPATAIFDIQAQRTSKIGLGATVDRLGMAEPTASIVWKALLKNKIPPEQVVLWNIFPWHPFKAGKPLSNRTPSNEELLLGFAQFKNLLALFPGCKILCLGKKSEATILQGLPELKPIALRHPANGGAKLFENGLIDFLHANGIREL